MATLKAKGIIIKQSDYGEANRMLTIFTDEYGIIKASSYGAKRINSKQAGSTQFLCYSNFVLYKGNSDIMTVSSVEPIDSFFPIQEDIEKLALCTYFADLIYHCLDLSNPDTNILRLLLNTLYVLAYKNMFVHKAKIVFEVRMMAYTGFMPAMQNCIHCGSEENLTHFSIRNGGMVCKQCKCNEDVYITPNMYAAMIFILNVHDKKVFSFNVGEEDILKISRLSENYLTYQFDREFASLKYFKKLYK